jgi:transcriptional regulator with XRE-family HTH domain
MTQPLNWKSLVEEALRRRKKDGLNQREHAALADVSIPTMSSFERGETTLSLAKAFDILRVVGLMDEPGPEGEHERFVREAMARWRELTETLPKDSPGRMPHGWFRFDYQLVGELKAVDLAELEGLLDKAELNHTGWPLFLIPREWETKPLRVQGSHLECWLYDEKHIIKIPSWADFWTANPAGNFLLVRGYKEDEQETFAPATIFDTSNPIWRIGEALRHAEKMARLMSVTPNADITINFRATYTGLLGRVLKSWANPMVVTGYEGRAALRDEVVCNLKIKAGDISKDLTASVSPLINGLYSCFGVSEVPHDYVEAALNQMLTSSVRNRF